MSARPTSLFLSSSCFIILFFSSCKKNISSFTANESPKSFSQVFDVFWNKMNTDYLYWDIDTTNWDDAYIKFKPIFERLNLQNKGDVQKSIGYFKQMTGGLIDSHYSINFMPTEVMDSFVFPSLNRKKMNPNFHSPFDYISIDSNFLDKKFVSGKYQSSTNSQIVTVCGTIKHKILYFYCSGFALKEAFTSPTPNGAKNVLKFFFDQLQNLSSSSKGIIIDVRNNKGGNLEDLNFLVGHLTDKPILFGYTHNKSNNGRLAFTPWVNAIIKPELGAKNIQIPIIVMADNFSASLAELVIMAIKILPNSLFVGETTWGATGPITNNIVYNDGSFVIPTFLSVITSSAAFKYIDENRYEGKGFSPDIYVPFNFPLLLSRNDPQFDTAVSIIK